jgi:cell division septation protein DedD
MDRFIPEAQRRDGLALAAAMETGAARSARVAGAAAQAPLRPPLSTTPVRTTALPPSAPVARSAPSAPPPAPAPAAPPHASAGGAFQVQLGAFGEKARAETQWKLLSAKIPALAAYQHSTQSAGAMTRLLAGPLKTRADAEALCARVTAGGGACIAKPLPQ